MLQTLMLGLALLFPTSAIHKAQDTSVLVNANLTQTIHQFDDDGTPLDDVVKHAFNQRVCSGYVAWSKGTFSVVVTARHCAESHEITFFGVPVGDVNIEPSTVRYYNGDVGVVMAVAKDEKLDLAVLAVRSLRKHPYADLRKDPVHLAERIFVYGSPGDFTWMLQPASVLQGNIPVIRDPKYPQWSTAFALDCPSCGGGDSGAGVYDDAGRVVGILVAGTGGDPLFSLAVPAADVKSLLDRVW